MTLSLHHMATLWDRTLPRPSALLPNGSLEGFPRRNTSLLQHHIVPNQLLNPNDEVSEDDGRRSTVACIPVTRIPEQSIVHENGNGVATAHLDLNESLARTRTSSVMSTEGTSRSSSPISTSPTEGSNLFCLCQPGPHIPRPRNAFILYRQNHHAGVVAQHPGLPNPEISKIIGEQWRQLPDKKKEEWKALAEDEKVRHAQQFPDYRYKPKRSSKLGRQSSVSGPSSASSDTRENCKKCGGKPMNAPPHTPYTPVTPMAPGISQMNNRMQTTTQIVSPPHSARLRQYTDMYGRPVGPPHDPRFQYPSVQQRVVPNAEGPELKKRRFNGDTVFAPSRQLYADQNYQRSPHDRTMSEAIAAGQFHRPNMGPPARTGYPVQIQNVRPALSQQHRRDPSLTLPPLKTPLSQQTHVSLTSSSQSQKSGVEAMIMSIPVLNKVKILSQISPSLAAPGPASPPREMRGAIIAVEGMDPSSVYNMTHTLAEQLEREDKFAVRIFGGPDPYAMLASSNRASSGEGEYLSTADFLDLISQWHKVSKEMQEYITRKPKLNEANHGDVMMQDANHTVPPEFTSSIDDKNVPRPKTPVSAVSPKTITQTADLSLKSPPVVPPKASHQSEQISPTKTPQSKPRIPASAIAQAEAEEEAKTRQRSESATPRPSTSQTQKQAARRPTSSQQSASTDCIPIAIVPHYQLTTVDASSIAMPINDAYSPHSHWQWLATLWRGCVGPDVSVIIKAGDTVEDEQHSAGAMRAASQGFNPPPANQPGLVTFGAPTTAPRPSIPQQQAPQQPPQDVEVRLVDCRAIVVRAANSGRGRSDGENSEWWDKAKRRVGFEVEEFLRR